MNLRLSEIAHDLAARREARPTRDVIIEALQVGRIRLGG